MLSPVLIARHIWHGNLPVKLHNLRRARSREPRRLASHPVPNNTQPAARRINALSRALPDVRRYLEIGLYEGRTFEEIEVPIRHGVDPFPRFDVERLAENMFVWPVPSDDFFESLDPGTHFDLVYLDGLHTVVQTYRDLINSLRVCPAGVVLVDDVVPSHAVSAMEYAPAIEERKRQGLPENEWHGDVFRVIPLIRGHHPELAFRTIVGSGRPQALIWRRDPYAASNPVAGSVLDDLSTISYDDVFSEGIPKSFEPCDEQTAMEAAVAAVRSYRLAGA